VSNPSHGIRSSERRRLKRIVNRRARKKASAINIAEAF
jgi:hypothetical protein